MVLRLNKDSFIHYLDIKNLPNLSHSNQKYLNKDFHSRITKIEYYF